MASASNNQDSGSNPAKRQATSTTLSDDAGRRKLVKVVLPANQSNDDNSNSVRLESAAANTDNFIPLFTSTPQCSALPQMTTLASQGGVLNSSEKLLNTTFVVDC